MLVNLAENEPSEFVTENAHDLIQTTRTTAFTSSFSDVLNSTTGSLFRGVEDALLSGRADSAAQEMADEFGFAGAGRERQDLGEWIEPEQFKEEFGYLGLTADRAMPRALAEKRAERKKKELVLQDRIARAPAGVLTTGAVFAGAMARTLLDPLDVAASFIPVFGQARFAALAARVGKNTARLTRGAVEGAVGNALVEPVIYRQALQDQADYDAYDALFNVFAGAVIGAPLHLAAGKIADFNTPVIPESVRADALRAAVAQVAQGEKVDVRPILDVVNRAVRPRGERMTDVELLSPFESRALDSADPATGIGADGARIGQDGTDIAPATGTDVKAPKGQDSAVARAGEEADSKADTGTSLTEPRRAQVLLDEEGAPRVFKTEDEAKRAAKRLDDTAKAEGPSRFERENRPRVLRDKDGFLVVRGIDEGDAWKVPQSRGRKRLADDPKKPLDPSNPPREQLLPPEPKTRVRQYTRQEAKSIADERANPAAADPLHAEARDASERAEQIATELPDSTKINERIDDALKEVLDEVQALHAQGHLTDQELEAITKTEDLTARLGAVRKGSKAVAVCMGRF